MASFPYVFRLSLLRLCLAIGLALPFLLIANYGRLRASRISSAHRSIAHWSQVEGELLAVEFGSDDPVVRYKYAVRGREFDGSTFAVTECNTSNRWIMEECRRLEPALGKPGALIVYYDPDVPARSCLYMKDVPAWVNVISACFPLMLAVGLFVAALLQEKSITTGSACVHTLGKQLGQEIEIQREPTEQEKRWAWGCLTVWVVFGAAASVIGFFGMLWGVLRTFFE